MTRWGIFSLVGLIGIGVQLVVLNAATTVLSLPYLIATAIAVEAAILHNFAWHECWTWRDRAGGSGRWTRLAGFHGGNGMVSLAGNLVLMRIFVEWFALPIMIANLLAVALCSVINFSICDTVVYQRSAR